MGGSNESETVSCFILPGGVANPCVVFWQVAWKIDRMIMWGFNYFCLDWIVHIANGFLSINKDVNSFWID